MDKVIFMCDGFAILERGRAGRPSAAKEAQAACDLKPGSRGFLAGQAKPYLELYGRRLELDPRLDFVEVASDAVIDLNGIARCGYGVSRIVLDDEKSRLFLERTGDYSVDTYVAAIDGAAGRSLLALNEAVLFAARLACMAAGEGASGLDFSVWRGVSAGTITVSFAGLPGWFKGAGVELAASRVLSRGGRPAAGDLCEIRCSRGEARVTLRNAALEGGGGGVGIERIAAGVLLVALMRADSLVEAGYTVDLESASVVHGDDTSLIAAVAERAASGQVRACPRCGRPVIGGSRLCRFGDCRQRFGEQARAEARGGKIGLDEAFARYGEVFRERTIRLWFDGGAGGNT